MIYNKLRYSQYIAGHEGKTIFKCRSQKLRMKFKKWLISQGKQRYRMLSYIFEDNTHWSFKKSTSEFLPNLVPIHPPGLWTTCVKIWLGLVEHFKSYHLNFPWGQKPPIRGVACDLQCPFSDLAELFQSKVICVNLVRIG